MTTDITVLTAEKLEEIRQRYRPTLAPKCHICGVEMTIQRMSASRITYGCAGAIYDETGCHYAEGRSLADDHYAESRITVVDVSDPDVLAMVEALEKAQGMEAYWKAQCRGITDHCEELQARIAELESHKAALLKFIRDSCYVFDGADEDISDAYVDAITSGLMPKLESVTACNPPLFWVRVKSDGGYEGPIHDSKLEEVRKKSGEWLPLTLAGGIPELESRTVTVKLPKDHVDDADLFGWGVVVVPLEALKEACTDAGVTVEITAAGIKVEVE